MARSPKKLNRLLRVRTLQLDLVRAEEAQARAHLEQADSLRQRIAALAAEVSPVPSPTPSAAVGLQAAAHYRERLHQSADAAADRAANASARLDAASEATREARRDQSAIEKLIDRERAAAIRREFRALENLPAFRKVRHDPC